ncbi:hypothetical protein LguiA_022912 [Lonicera macranthoides]
MSPELLRIRHCQISQPQQLLSPSLLLSNSNSCLTFVNQSNGLSRSTFRPGCIGRRSPASSFTTATKRQSGRLNSISASLQPLDLTEENVSQVLADARVEARVAELAEVDGPFVKISLRGRFWHERSLVLARLGNYLKQRIPEILEVDIEDEKQLDDSPENF